MSDVIRVFVEKKPGFDVEAQHILADLVENLGMKSVTDVKPVSYTHLTLPTNSRV